MASQYTGERSGEEIRKGANRKKSTIKADWYKKKRKREQGVKVKSWVSPADSHPFRKHPLDTDCALRRHQDNSRRFHSGWYST